MSFGNNNTSGDKSFVQQAKKAVFGKSEAEAAAQQGVQAASADSTMLNSMGDLDQDGVSPGGVKPTGSMNLRAEDEVDPDVRGHYAGRPPGIDQFGGEGAELEP